jgi:hypothetical protein
MNFLGKVRELALLLVVVVMSEVGSSAKMLAGLRAVIG